MTNTGALEPIGVLCVDDHRIVRDGIRLIVNSEPDMHVVGLAASGEEALVLHTRHAPDVVLMDLQLPGIDGVETIRAMRRHDAETRVIVLTMYTGDEDIHRALAAGAATYLLKDTLADDLPGIIREVYRGQRPITPDVRAKLAERAAQPTLTTREIEVMQCVAVGHRNKEIAAALSISEETVRVHVKNILSKLHVSDRTAAMRVALRRGIIHIK
jgi:DNA-binding NarL/FixJ family response regulator